MSDANRTAVGIVEETTLGTTPASPAFENLRVLGAGLAHAKSTASSKELRSDRQVPDLITTGFEAGGDLPQEASYGAMDSLLRGALMSDWVLAAVRQNVTGQTGNIAQITATTAIPVIASDGTQYRTAAFAAQMLLRASGFGQAGNNRQLVAGAGTTGTSIATTGAVLETPPIGARIKQIGFQGASGDITATASGLGSTTLNFTNMGLDIGEWIWIGGPTAGTSFANPVLKGWARVNAITATTLVCDILPAGWTTDTGAGKTINVYVGDYIRNGTTRRSYSIELQYQDLTVPEYEYYSGMVVNSFELSVTSQSIVTAKASFLGMNAVNQTSRFAGATDVAAPTNDVFNSSSNVGSFLENGAAIPGGNFVMGSVITISNNLRRNNAIGSLGSVGISTGQIVVTGTLQMYYGSNAILQKVRNSTASSYFLPLSDSTPKALLLELPRIKYAEGNPSTPGVDTDRVLDTKFQAVRHPILGYTIHIQRLEEYNT